MEVQIVKAFAPFTNSVVLLVEAESSSSAWLPSRFILKLADRRVAPNWDFDSERDYQGNIRSHGEAFGTTDIDCEDETLLPSIHMLKSWEYYNRCHFKEREAYQRLNEAQDLELVPRFFGTVQLSMEEPPLHPSLTHINGLLLEYVQGCPMASFRPGIDLSVEEAEAISQRVLQLGRDLRRYGVTHCDIHIGNIILRSTNNCPVLIDWGRANFRFADLPLEERWTAHPVRQDFNDDIRFLLRHGNDDDTIVAGGVWHRYRTPISDLEQYRKAQDSSWGYVNHRISELSRDEIERFYDEDKTVDSEHGLRWRVKKDVRTRMYDDPVPRM